MSDNNWKTEHIPSSRDSSVGAINTLTKNLANLRGADLINNTTALTGKWCRLVCLADASIAAFTSSEIAITGSLPFVMKTGNEISGEFTAITLGSGTVIAYKQDATTTAAA